MQDKKIIFHYAIAPAKGGFNIKTVQWILLIILFIYIYVPLDYLKNNILSWARLHKKLMLPLITISITCKLL